VLNYYEDLAQANLFDATWLDRPEGGSVLDQLASDQINAAQIDATDYLRLLASNQTRWKAAPIPSLTNTPPVVIDGWLWAITTTDEARRTEALAVIDWLSENQRLSQYARAMHVIPLRPSALQAAFPQTSARDYLDLVARTLNAPVVLPDQVDPLVLGALQGAFEDVINQRRSATDAAEIALALVNKP
jgi:ABC-type glycerol-3-phosphate transport system substrate-binding protein